jgi:glutathione synthase/RimK-type ligase-like ATP-grasp enzyme/gamma-glutamyl:cysteine ligase YbdK (ATP-grasp superfamily)
LNRRRAVVVVSSRRDMPELPAERVVTADDFLSGGEPASPRITVINLSRSYRYRTKGYYVSLLADARGHRVIPSIEAIEGLSEQFGLFRVLREAGVAAEPDAAADADADGAETLAYFGQTPDSRFRAAALAIYREWPVPVLRLRMVRSADEWMVSQVAPVSLSQLTVEERAPLVEALLDEQGLVRRGSPVRREMKRASIAVLFDEKDRFSPSTPETLDRLDRVAAKMNVYVHRIAPDEIEKLGEYDALFIRSLTGVREPAFQFALRAEMLDMPVIDDPQSIIRCSNKVFLEELLRREGIPTPRTLVATSKTPWEEICDLGSPVVIKLPDGSFSTAVHKCADAGEYQRAASEMFRRSPLIIAQEFLPTEYDWRVTVLDGRVLFTARYHMARGHWQVRADDGGGERYGRVEAVPRREAPKPVQALALRAAALIGDGLYGVDIKETAGGPVVIEINDNPNLDIGYDDAADGSLIYEDLVNFFLRRIEDVPGNGSDAARDESAGVPTVSSPRPPERHYRPFEVAGMELEYAVVDRDLNAVSLVEPGLRALAGRPTSDVDLGSVAFSNEIADHVFEVKTPAPAASLVDTEEALVEGVQRFSALLRSEFGARLLPTGMHPWLDPKRARIWSRSNTRIYRTYERLFDVQTHGWMNVQAAHLNLPFGREAEAVAMYNAASLVIPYLPALAASSPMYQGELQEAVDNRLAWIMRHQARIPESQGLIVPERVESIADYRKRILGPMYDALDKLPGSGPLRHEFFNARGAVFKFSRKSMELRVLDTQECVKLDVAIAAYVRNALKGLTRKVTEGKMLMPDHAVLVEDFRACIARGSAAMVRAPHFCGSSSRDDDGKLPVREVLRSLLPAARRAARRDESDYLDLVERIIESGTLSERIREQLLPHVHDEEEFTECARRIYIELADCLESNEPWKGRGL